MHKQVLDMAQDSSAFSPRIGVWSVTRCGTDFRSAAFLRRSFRREHVKAFSSNDLLSCCGPEARRETNRSSAWISITAVPKFLREELFQHPQHSVSHYICRSTDVQTPGGKAVQ